MIQPRISVEGLPHYISNDSPKSRNKKAPTLYLVEISDDRSCVCVSTQPDSSHTIKKIKEAYLQRKPQIRHATKVINSIFCFSKRGRHPVKTLLIKLKNNSYT